MTAADGRFFAPAKVNLALHVTGQRADGYHLLSSLVAFADIGDWVTARPAAEWALSVNGPLAKGVPTGPDNLILKAARATQGPPAAFTLEKHLPMQAGIGGGSADAAAALRALRAMDGRPLPDGPAAIGADLPVCLHGRAALMTGIGDIVTPVDPLPPLHAVLVNPGVAVATPAVFAALAQKDNAPLSDLPDDAGTDELIGWLASQRNDLEALARSIAPAIGVALARLSATPGCALARMSGSGATCFGLYRSAPEARDAATTLTAAHPDWWIRQTSLA
ncbi:4-(cytidine 5'-diphospho)-2-C-methyl-D-erythritol kinase [Maribius pontilimi]|uniref:4-diphosphocytidyl-2-C-methyl-D-erythritol kinase n=1 Tax=Palleronia pontilimi TaxID=1964209 RepID=A0A934IGB2_9RHOB|nr:4-(cytidine 5'-diphospho)-2-C-methyl-D-erythritol kinase [Palleronia pontilimi]MBJ3761339.1 4-(cytidine 5'-diphospho)-2-C-methyl-D-erythritol kinase [Palleronia pontilimi]